MKLAVFNDHRVGVVENDMIYDVTAVLPESPGWPLTYMSSLIFAWDERKSAVLSARESASGIPLADVQLLTPSPAPAHIVAAAANYREHIAEMGVMGSGGRSMNELGFFLIAPSSIQRPGGTVVLPRGSSRSFHHESELAVIIGRHCKNVDVESALDYVFGYSCLMDMTMRMTVDLREERSMRKSFDTFTPVGPWIVTADEVPDPQQLELALYVNEERRQSATTADMIVSIAQQIALASSVMTLQPGDILATGTPSGVGEVLPGDVVRIEIENVGGFSVSVEEAAEYAPVRF